MNDDKASVPPLGSVRWSTETQTALAPADSSGAPLLGFVPSQVAAEASVLFVTSMWPDEVRPHYGPFILSQAQSLEDAGIGVDTLVIRGYASSAAYLQAPVALKRLHKHRRYDVIHVHTGHAAAAAIWACPRPRILSYVGGDLLGLQTEHGITRKSRLEKDAFRHLARFADVTITKSAEMERALPASLQDRNVILPNGVHLENFRRIDKRLARQRLGWPEDERVAIFVGNRDDPRKNFALAAKATSKAGAEGHALRLRVVWGVPPAEVSVAMSAADCLVFPSRGEGSPNVIKEAMAMELPIVASPVGDVEERLHGVEGCFVAAATVEDFASALVAASKLGVAPAAREAVAGLSAERVAKRLIDLYASVCPRSSRELQFVSRGAA